MARLIMATQNEGASPFDNYGELFMPPPHSPAAPVMTGQGGTGSPASAPEPPRSLIAIKKKPDAKLVAAAPGQTFSAFWSDLKGDFAVGESADLRNVGSIAERAVLSLDRSLGGRRAVQDLEGPKPPPTISRFQCRPEDLAADEAVIGIIDHGFPLLSGSFGSRVIALWDQGRSKPPLVQLPHWEEQWHDASSHNSVPYGSLLRRPAYLPHAQVIAHSDEYSALSRVGYTAVDRSWTHGAAVADLAAGTRDPMSFSCGDEPLAAVQQPGASDKAGAAKLLLVQLPRTSLVDTTGAAMDVHVLSALQFMLHAVNGRRLFVNLSYGTYAGPHDGSSFLEQAIDDLCEKHTNLKVVLPAGNGRNEACHAVLSLTRSAPTASVEVALMPDNQRQSFLELWWPASAGDFALKLISPDRRVTELPRGSLQRGELGSDAVVVRKQLVDGDAASPVSNSSMLVVFAPTQQPFDERPGPSGTRTGPSPVAAHGRWRLIVDGRGSSAMGGIEVHAYLERGDTVLEAGDPPTQARFVVDAPEHPDSDYAQQSPVKKHGTLSAYATGTTAIVVGGRYRRGGAYGNPGAVRVAEYSGAGPGRGVARAFGPCVLAVSDDHPALPGVLVARPFGVGTVRLNGTSMAAPQVLRKLYNGEALHCTSECAPQCVVHSATGIPPVSAYDGSDLEAIAAMEADSPRVGNLQGPGDLKGNA